MLDRAESVRRTEEAIAQVDKAEDLTQWKAVAIFVIRELATTKHEVLADDVWESDLIQAFEPPREPRVLGAVFRQAQSLGYIAATNRVAKSQRPEAHRSIMTVWESRLFSGSVV